MTCSGRKVLEASVRNSGNSVCLRVSDSSGACDYFSYI